MKFGMRPYGRKGCALLIAGAMAIPAMAQVRRVVQLVNEPSPLLRTGSQGYLGVDLADVDQEKSQQLKLKEVRGAVITLIDHDAPAGQIGLKVNDVVLKLNDQTVEGAEQLRRMLKEIPAGRKVSLVISRDGNVQTLAVELADRLAMEHRIWNNIRGGGDPAPESPGKSILGGGSDAPMGTPGWHMPFFGSTLNVGAVVEPLVNQMADYLGVSSGLMIKAVTRKSEAAAAGLKPNDVILKVGSEPISTAADWDRALRSNQGKPVQVTILREKKQQTVTLQVDSKRHGELIFENLFPGDEQMMVAELGSEIEGLIEAGILGERGGELMPSLSPEGGKSAEEEAGKSVEGLMDFKPESFRPDMEQLKDGMRIYRLDIPKDFEDRIQRQMKQEMEHLRQQMEEMKALGFGDHI